MSLTSCSFSLLFSSSCSCLCFCRLLCTSANWTKVRSKLSFVSLQNSYLYNNAWYRYLFLSINCWEKDRELTSIIPVVAVFSVHRPISERPFSERPISERPIFERPFSERPIPEFPKMRPISECDQSPNDQSPNASNSRKYSRFRLVLVITLFSYSYNKNETCTIIISRIFVLKTWRMFILPACCTSACGSRWKWKISRIFVSFTF
jgi:hypothetical protein